MCSLQQHEGTQDSLVNRSGKRFLVQDANHGAVWSQRGRIDQDFAGIWPRGPTINQTEENSRD
jgi:hypothetical protein